MKKARKSRKVDYDKNFVGVTQKVFAVLESLSQQPKAGVSLDEITSLSGLPKTTVHRLLYSMNKLEYVEQDPISNLYSLSGKFFELGTNALPYQRLMAIAKPLMQRLLLTFGESVNLAVPQPGSLMYIHVVESPKAHRVAATVGEQVAPSFHFRWKMYCRIPFRGRAATASDAIWHAVDDFLDDNLPGTLRAGAGPCAKRGSRDRQ